MERPIEGEHNPYFSRYINLIPEGDFYSILRHNTETMQSVFGTIGEEKENYAYAPGKWTVSEMLLHITDTERVMSFRALVAARGDKQANCPNMDQDLFASNADINGRSLAMLLDEFMAVRKASAILFENISSEKSKWRVNVSGHSTSSRALGYVIIGHSMHHIKILEEKYLIQ